MDGLIGNVHLMLKVSYSLIKLIWNFIVTRFVKYKKYLSVFLFSGMMELSMNEAILNFTFTTNKKLNLCDCLPGCHELSFGFVISSAPITDHLTLKPNFQGDKDYKYFK